MKFELKLDNNEVVEWDGTDAVNAAERFVDCHRDRTVKATRPSERHGIFVLGSTDQIIG